MFTGDQTKESNILKETERKTEIVAMSTSASVQPNFVVVNSANAAMTSTSQSKVNDRYGDSSQTTEDLTLINFELSKDIS